MNLWPAAVVLDGVTMSLDEVRADVTIHHGRADAFSSPEASTCQIVFLELDHAFTQSFQVGVSLVVTVSDGVAAPVPRFTGRVTDAALDVDALTVIAAGRLSELGQYRVGEVSWPAEPWFDRVERVFLEAGLEDLLLLEAPARLFDPVLAARDYLAAGSTTLSDYLSQLAGMVGAAVADLPDGRILVQAVGERDPIALTAPGHDGDLDPAVVAYAPAWSQLLPAGNIVTVSYTPGATLPPRTGTLSDGSPVVTGIPETLDIIVGMDVRGLGIPQDTRVQSVDSSTQITLSRSANTSAVKDGSVSPGENVIDSMSDTSDLSEGMVITAGGDLQPGTTIVAFPSHSSVQLSHVAVGTHVGAFTFSCPNATVLNFNVDMAYITQSDAASVAHYGERPIQIDTTFLDVDDANRRATERLARSAFPRWNLPAAPILTGLELLIGRAVLLTGMPASAPSTDWRAFLEGWTETITGDVWTMELALSDPSSSGVTYVFTWELAAPEWSWDELDPLASWEDATSLEGITP